MDIVYLQFVSISKRQSSIFPDFFQTRPLQRRFVTPPLNSIGIRIAFHQQLAPGASSTSLAPAR
jgi:hypothetical protein